ncbi:MAG: DUF5050 domain-containing protein [Clostridia bacterium]|nr:DUF5050 domain-containing protein [Clostridia bacterium]
MRNRIVAFFLLLALLLGLSSCGKIQVEDTFTNGLKWGNTLATEQGDWIALRGEEDGKVGLVLYNKKKNDSRFLVEGDIYYIAMLGNKIFFKYLQGSELYCYDLAEKSYSELLSGVMAYQVHGNTVYYITDEHGAYVYTFDLTTGEGGQIDLKHTANAFWITDHGLYYHDDTKDLFIVKPFETDLESIIYRGVYEHCRDVVSLNGGADIAFLIDNSGTQQNTLCTYDAENAKITKHLSGSFTYFNVAGDRLITVNDHTIVSVDYANRKNYDWGSLEEYDYLQIMSDSLILYTGDKPTIQYYPEIK